MASKRFEKQSIKEDKRLTEKLSTAEIPGYLVTKESKDDTYLKTGWYYITDSLNGVARTFYKRDSISYYINKEPILTIDNFTRLAVYESDNGDRYVGLIIFFDDVGTDSWRIATEKSVYGNRLGLIVNNVLIHDPKVYSTISSGISAINRLEYTPEEIMMFRQLLQEQMNLK